MLDAARLLIAEQSRALTGQLNSLERAGTTVSCRAGCSACCRQLVLVSPLEAHYLAAWASSDPADWIARHERWEHDVHSRLNVTAALEALRSAGGYVDPGTGDRIERSYWSAQIPCPWLVDDRCSAYDARPFSCREHFVLSPPVLCTGLDAPEPAPTHLGYRAVAVAVGEECFGLPDRLLPLADAVTYAAGDPASLLVRVPTARFFAVAAAAQRRVRLAMARLTSGLTGS